MTVDGRDFYLGRQGPAAIQAEYDRLIAPRVFTGGRLLALVSGDGFDKTVDELMLAYRLFAEVLHQERQAADR